MARVEQREVYHAPSLQEHLSDLSCRATKSKIEISKDVFLYTYKSIADEEFFVVFEIECLKYCSGLQVVLDFQGSENLSVISFDDNRAGLTKQTTFEESPAMETRVAPFQRKKFGQVTLMDPTRRAILKYKYSSNVCKVVRKDMLLSTASKQQKQISNYIQLVKRIVPDWIPSSNHLFCSFSYYEMKQIFANNQNRGLTSFIDLSFPPNDSSVRPTIPEAQDIQTDFPIAWNRPQSFLNGSFQMYTDGIDPSDIRQGYLADCWLLSAIAALAEFPSLIQVLFPNDTDSIAMNKFGCYQVRLCIGGMWTLVYLDDYFPCFPVQNGGPIFSQSHGNELWVLLLEKAFAKVRKSYANLRFGSSLNALIDLTGAPFRHVNLKIIRDDCATELWEQILEYDIKGYVMSGHTTGFDQSSEDLKIREGSSIHADSNQGLVLGHAYTVLSAKVTSTGDCLLKLRNPWGMFEWKGDWADDSPFWTSDLLKELDYTLDVDDGTFWMAFSDFLHYFVSFDVCMVRQPPELSPWYDLRRKIWVVLPSLVSDSSESVSLACKTSGMFVLHVSSQQPVETIFSIHQGDKPHSDENGQAYIDIGITVLQIESNGSLSFCFSSGLAVDRQMQASGQLQQGVYLVVPMTTGAKLQQFKVAAGNGASRIKILDDTEQNFEKEVSDAFDEIFDRLDANCDGILSKEELDLYMTITNEGNAVEDKVYTWLLSSFDSHKGCLTRKGFREVQLYMYKASGLDDMTLLRDLYYMGYDENLQLRNTESLAVVCHSESQSVSLKQVGFDIEAYQEAFRLLSYQRECEVRELCNGELKLYISEAGSNQTGASLAMENCSDSDLLVELDCSESTNTMSHRGALKHTSNICPGDVVTFHVLYPIYLTEEWSWKYCVNIIES